MSAMIPGVKLTDTQYDVLRSAVNLARNEQIHSTTALRSRLSRMGYESEDIRAALGFWGAQIASQESRTNPRFG